MTLCFSLTDPHDRLMAAMKRAHDASHLGLLVVIDDPDSREDAVMWFQQATSLTLVSQNGDIMIGNEVRGILPRYFTVFFDEIKDVMPDLAAVKFAVVRTGDKNLH